MKMGNLLKIFFILAFTVCCKAISLSNRESFESTSGKDFDRTMSEADQDRVPKNVRLEPQFRYFTARQLDKETMKDSNFDSFKNSFKNSFDTNASTVFIVHGYLGGNAPWPVTIKDVLIEKEKCNVFIVDWSGLDGVWYGTASENVKLIGMTVGRFIIKLKAFLPLDLQKVHIVGHSLGAHVSGYAGKYVLKEGYKIGRITGLDPAGPEFNALNSTERLSQSDADFVDVIHTNWAEAVKGFDIASSVSGFGLGATIGHFDFYPNGGADQPGCKTALQAELDIGLDLYESSSLDSLAFNFLSGGYKKTKKDFGDLACSHSRAHEFFYWSIKDKENGCLFSADECTSWKDYLDGKCETPSDQLPKVQMGYYSANYKGRVKDKPEKFYLRTTATPPFCIK